jgi:BirA family biotin operon repressor/biotin-[acetyl-CoA-carboxylase] ligase
MRKESEKMRSLLLQILSDGQFHSGEALGQHLGISRTAVSNYVKGLSDLGLEIFSVTGKGYKLAKPLIFLSHEQISKELTTPDSVQLEVLNVIDSTNQYLKNKHQDVENGHVVIAEAQTAGRGRRGRQWVSPYGSSLYLSLYWNFPAGYQAIGGLSLAIGVAVVQALHSLSVLNIQLKWPNDIYLDGKKLAGVLVEVEGQMGAACDSIIGVGLNINLPDGIAGIDQPFTDLTHSAQADINRNSLAAHLINQLYNVCRQFEKEGLLPFVETWQSLDLYQDKAIKLIAGNNIVEGIGRGIDNAGGLIVEVDGVRKAYYGGEVSVKAN